MESGLSYMYRISPLATILSSASADTQLIHHQHPNNAEVICILSTPHALKGKEMTECICFITDGEEK